jgi:hypothetical protein
LVFLLDTPLEIAYFGFDEDFRIRASGSGFREGFRFREKGGFTVSSFGFRVPGFVSKVSDFGIRVSGLRKVSGFGFEEGVGVGATNTTKERPLVLPHHYLAPGFDFVFRVWFSWFIIQGLELRGFG